MQSLDLHKAGRLHFLPPGQAQLMLRETSYHVCALSGPGCPEALTLGSAGSASKGRALGALRDAGTAWAAAARACCGVRARSGAPCAADSGRWPVHHRGCMSGKGKHSLIAGLSAQSVH